MDVTHDREIEVCLPDPVPLVSPEGALLMMASAGIFVASSAMTFVVPVAAIAGKAMGLIATDTLATAGYALVTEGALATTACLSAWFHRTIFGVELKRRRRLIEKRRLLD